jgi:hypothetical protein
LFFEDAQHYRSKVKEDLLKNFNPLDIFTWIDAGIEELEKKQVMLAEMEWLMEIGKDFLSKTKMNF